jgi:uncharacterized protein (TIGR02117 family)
MTHARSLLLALALAVQACAAPGPAPDLPREGEPAVKIYLVAHDWHTGIVLRRADIPHGLWPETRDFPQAEYLEVGWGDREYYPAPEPGLWMTLKAAFWPTPSALHVVAVHGPVAAFFPRSEVVELAIRPEGMERLARYIDDAHERAGAPVAARIAPAQYGEGWFYAARETFHLLRTCNVWTARALRAAGVPVRDAITSRGIMSQAREIARAVNAPQR